MSSKTPSASFASDEERWLALEQRNHGADGLFFYAVRSTGVFCRPSCPSRKPRRENVTFFQTASDAEAAGYRPCKRCAPGGKALEELHAQAITAACRRIGQADAAPSLAKLARTAGMSPFHFHRIFKRMTGLTPKAYAQAMRAEAVRDQLSAGESVTSAIYAAGYASNARFYEKSAEILGMPPRRYQLGGEGSVIRFAVGECSLGTILVAASEKGVCAISLGDDPDLLIRALEKRFSQATLIGGDGDFEQLVAQVVGFVEGPGQSWELPLDVRGTAFQQRVWKAIQAIPPGQRVTYAELAQSIGQPKAVRAVAQACGANPVAIAIPCHRVVRRDGGLSGYRWGVERKRELLKRESSLEPPDLWKK